MCWEFGLVNSVIQKLWRNRTKIINAFEQNGSRIEPFQKLEQNESVRCCYISATSRQRTYHGCSGGTELETQSRTES